MLSRVIWLFLSTTAFGLLVAGESVIDRSGNLNVNVIDGKVIVNGKVVKRVPKGEPVDITVENGRVFVGGEEIKGVGRSSNSSSRINTTVSKDRVGADIGDIGAHIDKDSIGAHVGENIGAKIDKSGMSANVGGISASISGDVIRANIGSILGSVLNRKKSSKDTKDKDDDFFGGDEFFK